MDVTKMFIHNDTDMYKSIDEYLPLMYNFKYQSLFFSNFHMVQFAFFV